MKLLPVSTIAIYSLIGLVLSGQARAEDSNPACQQAYQSKDFTQVIKHCRSDAEAGKTEAAFRMGEAYDFLDKLKNHSQQAEHWYQIAAKKGHPLAQRNLAALYDGGFGIERDPFKAFHWYHQAAKQGQPQSELMTGMMYLYGTGTAQNREQAEFWFKKAAYSGEPNAEYMYGKIVYDKDEKAGVDWYKKAAAQHNMYALYQLGLLHYRGEHLLASDQAALAMADESLKAGYQKAELLKQKLLARMQSESVPVQANSTSDKSSSLGATTSTQAKNGAAWLLSQPAEYYSVQLALMSQATSIKRFAKLYPQLSPTYSYQSHFNNGNMYVLLYGQFRSVAEAKAAIAQLPAKLQKMKPWVRQFGVLQQQYVQPR